MTKEFWEKMMKEIETMPQEKFDQLVKEFDEDTKEKRSTNNDTPKSLIDKNKKVEV